jgi:predicted N-formylglutamate amidohydrolase
MGRRNDDGAKVEPAFSLLRPEGRGKFVLLCDHASNHVPAALNQLGLGPSELSRHIAWDIGAARLTAILSELLDAPAILGAISRLVIDCNRQRDARDLIPEISDGTVIPGNLGLSERARASRIERWFIPYHDAVESILTARTAEGLASMVLSIHSMTARMAGCLRPWQIALSSHRDRRFVEPMLAVLRRSGDIIVGDNQPYDLDPMVDFSIPYHAMRRNLPYLQVEFRQDEVANIIGQENWARRFATALIEATPGMSSPLF